MTRQAQILELVDQLRAQVPPGAQLRLDSRTVQAGDVFLACPGLSGDGRDFIDHAVARGAAAVVYEGGLATSQQDVLEAIVAYPVENLKSWLGALAHLWWDRPSDALTVIAVTGTNGKTTTAWWLAGALSASGHPCGLIGTLGVCHVQGQLVSETSLTTPDVVSLHRQLAHLREEGATHVVLEASSIGLDQGRLDAVTIQMAVFTNLTRDHLDYHQDMARYGQAKAQLFERGELQFAVINADDPAASSMVRKTAAKVVRYGIDESDRLDWSAREIAFTKNGVRFDLLSEGHHPGVRVHTTFVGLHNVSNLLAVAATLNALGLSNSQIVSALKGLPAVPGRMESVVCSKNEHDQPRVFVDYAHTPDALERVLGAAQSLAQVRGGQVWCVAGCGGERDQGKRTLMGEVLGRCADRFVVTSDNPRAEDPQEILSQVWAGVQHPDKGRCELQREDAILSTIWQADARDVVVIAGKGHETWQQFASGRRFFDDRQWARLALLFAPRDAQDIPCVEIDSRKVASGSLFVALAGERTDGHAFLQAVKDQGGRAALVSRADDALDLPQIVVDDTRKALQALARIWRQRFDLPVIAVTGSNGKTTTKEMLASILSLWAGEGQSLATQGNLNNELGVPLTLLRLRSWHKAAVIELGMNHCGEIAQLAAMTSATVALVLNAQREHQEFMGTVQAVAQENGEVLKSLPAHGTAVYLDQPPYTQLWSQLSEHTAHQWSFGLTPPNDVYARDLRLNPSDSQFVLCTAAGEWPLVLPVPGEHNVYNSLASAACALAVGVEPAIIVQALQSFQAVQGRMQIHHLQGQQVLIDDTYNANPDSALAAIDVLKAQRGPRALVLGDMGEVGEDGPQMHHEIGVYARKCGIENLWALGQASRHAVQAFGAGGQSFESHLAVISHAKTHRPASMLVKGSRFMAMEQVVQAILSAHQTSAPTVDQQDEERHHAG